MFVLNFNSWPHFKMLECVKILFLNISKCVNILINIRVTFEMYVNYSSMLTHSNKLKTYYS